MQCVSGDSWLARAISRLPAPTTAELCATRDRVSLAMKRANFLYRGRPTCRALEPLVFDGETHDRNLERASIVAQAIAAAVKAQLADPKLRRALGFAPYIDEFLEIDALHDAIPLLGRFDGFVDNTGALSSFIEFNGPWCGGLTFNSELKRLFAGEPAEKALAGIGHVRRNEDPLDRLWQALHHDAEAHGLVGNLRIASPSSNMKSDQRLWVPYLATRGATVFVAPVEQFEFDGKNLTFSGETIHYVAFEDLLPIYGGDARFTAIRAALTAGCVRSMQSVSFTILAGSKSIFELLSNPEYRSLFDDDTATVLDELIPWTRVLSDRNTTYQGEMVDLLPFVRERQNQLVIKPSTGGLAGAGVVLGWQADAATWEKAIKTAKRRPCVVQERVAPPPRCALWMYEGEETNNVEVNFDTQFYVWNMTNAEHLHIRANPGDGVLNLMDSDWSMVPYLIVDPLHDE